MNRTVLGIWLGTFLFIPFVSLAQTTSSGISGSATTGPGTTLTGTYGITVTFSSTPATETGGAPLTVTFIAPNVSDSAANNFTVNFGDGQTGVLSGGCSGPGNGCSQLRAIHTYSQPGVYTATLDNPQTESPAQIATITVTPITSATLRVTPTSGTAPLNVTATFESGSACSAYTLTWGDGTNDNYAGQPGMSCTAVVVTVTKTHTYSQPGVYTATLDNPQTESPAQIATITVSGTQTSATFNAQPTSGAAPLAVTFTSNGLTSGASNYSIEFGDGTSGNPPPPPTCWGCSPPTSWTANHTYSSAGTYTATLKDNSMTCVAVGCNIVGTKTITVSGTTQTLTFNAQPTSGAAPLAVVFTTNVSGSSVDFGDGGSASVTSNCYYGSAGCTLNSYSANHAYTTAGTYTATLRGTYCPSNGQTSCAQVISTLGTKTITVTPITSATFHPIFTVTSPASGNAPLGVWFNVSDGSNTDIIDFGDGTRQFVNGAGSDTLHTYQNAGTYYAGFLDGSGNHYANTLLRTVTVFPATSQNTFSVETLKTQIAVLLAQIERLKAGKTGAGPTTPTTTAASCPALSRTLIRGMQGNDVLALQKHLISRGLLAEDAASGYFGPLTEAAVKQWQSSQGLVSSGSAATTGYGVVGPATRVAIANSCSSNVSCTFNGQTIPNGASVTAYQSATVPFGQSCQAQTRLCTNGTLSGSYQYSSCSVGTANSCTFNGQTVANGASVTAYQSSSVPFGSQCTSQQRTCSNGTLSGSYAYASCTVGTANSCTFNDQTVANGASVTAYQSSTVPAGQHCVSQVRMCNNGVLSGTYQHTSCQISPGNPTPLVVGSSSHIVVMEYEAWFNPLMNGQFFASAGYRPQLTSRNVSVGYDSTDPAIIDQHLQWLKDLGVDAVIAEQTNGGPCDFGDAQICAQSIAPQPSSVVGPYTAQIHAINQGTLNLYPAFTQRGSAIKIIPMADGQDPLMYQPRGDGQLPFDVQLGQFYSYATQYPNENVIYQGKPLLLVFLAAGQDVNNPNSVFNKARAAIVKWQDKFTIRLMAGFLDSQPLLWSGKTTNGTHEVNPDHQVWSWLDRLNPSHSLFASYTTIGNRTKAFTVTSAAPSTAASNLWGGADVTLYRNGATYDDFFNYAKALNPIFLIVNQFNEYTPPDEGMDIEHSNDAEPTKEWGYTKFNYLKQKLQAYRATHPVGWLDTAANCDHVVGWSQDEDTPNAPTSVHFYINGPAGSGTFGDSATADVYRSDLCGAIGSCDHGFDWSVPAQFRDGQPHTIYAYGIDTTIANTNNALLSGSPKTFQCSNT